MSNYLITGGNPLSGEVKISGAKNAVLPIMTAAVLLPELSISNVPHLSDVKSTVDILRSLGVKCSFSNGELHTENSGAASAMLGHTLSRRLRSSILFLGTMLSAFGEAAMAYPGGCDLGGRPIDIHLEALKELGAEIRADEKTIYCRAKRLRGTRLHLRYPSVGATENIIFAALKAEGETLIYNAATEPEIMDLICLLNLAGAKIRLIKPAVIAIEGVRELNGVQNYRAIADRIEAGTFMAAAAATGGELYLNGVRCEQLKPLINIFKRAGAYISCSGNGLYICSQEKLKAVDEIFCAPYPSMPTDMAAQLCAVFCIAEGKTVICDRVYKHRCAHAEQLQKMGADISFIENSREGIFIINGKKSLYCASVEAPDLRAGAALAVAALAAEGTSCISGIEHIKRGYEDLAGKIKGIGGIMYEVGEL